MPIITILIGPIMPAREEIIESRIFGRWMLHRKNTSPTRIAIRLMFCTIFFQFTWRSPCIRDCPCVHTMIVCTHRKPLA